MPFVFIVVFSVSVVFYGMYTQKHHIVMQTERDLGGFNQSATVDKQLTKQGRYKSYNTRAADKTEKELANIIKEVDLNLQRTCRTLYYLTKDARVLDRTCPNPKIESNLWSFLGPLGSTGDLTSVMVSGTTTFNCHNIQGYGRYLLSKNLDAGIVSTPDAQLQYDLSGVTNSITTDPCGYSDLVKVR